MAFGAPPVDWTKPTRYHVMKGVSFNHEGWNIDTLYKKYYNICQDQGFFTFEQRYVEEFPQQPGGKNAIIVWFRGSKELDYKYTLTNIWCKMKLIYGPKPRPGSDPKSPTMAMYGTARFVFDAFIYTDYRSIWCKSAVLRLVRPFREKYLYYDKLELFAQDVRNDVSTIIRKLKEYCSYLPAIA